MGWKDLFKKKGMSGKDSPGPDPLHDLTLDKLKKGYLLDYDMRTWEVTAHNTYDWGDGDITHEWQLVSSDETLYLEREEDDDVYWSVNRKIAFSRLGPDISGHIKRTDDPPPEITFDGVTYYQEETAGGHFYKDGMGEGTEMLQWSYIDDSEERYLTIEQWGDDDFEASVGSPAQEYQFTNILPRNV